MYINDVYPSNSKVTKWIQKENCPSQVSNGQIKEEFKSVFSGKQPVLEFMEELAASSGKDRKMINVFCPLVCPYGFLGRVDLKKKPNRFLVSESVRINLASQHQLLLSWSLADAHR